MSNKKTIDKLRDSAITVSIILLILIIIAMIIGALLGYRNLNIMFYGLLTAFLLSNIIINLILYRMRSNIG